MVSYEMDGIILSLSIGIFLLPLLLCHHKETYFVVYKLVGKGTETGLYENAISTVKTRDYFSCVGNCVLEDRCVSIFYNSKDKRCVLRQEIVVLKEVTGETNWIYLVMRGALLKENSVTKRDSNTEPKKPTLLVFDVGPNILDPKTWNMTSYRSSKPWQPGSAAYDSNTLTLYWSGLSPGTGLMATRIGHVNDLTNPRTAQLTKAIVQGISIDPHERLLVYLCGKDVVARHLDDGTTNILASFPNKKPFESICRTAIFASRRILFFHHNKDRKLYGSSYAGKYSASRTTVIVSNLVVDEIGSQLLWTARDKKSIWSLDTYTFIEKKYLGDKGIYYIYPAPLAMLLWSYKRESFYVFYRDDSTETVEIQLDSSCQRNDCNVTTIIQLVI